MLGKPFVMLGLEFDDCGDIPFVRELLDLNERTQGRSWQGHYLRRNSDGKGSV